MSNNACHDQATRDIDLLKEKRVISPEKETALYDVLVEMYAHYDADNQQSGAYVKRANDIIESCPLILE